MPDRSSKKDFNELAFSIVQRATGEQPDPTSEKIPLVDALDNDELRKEIMREMGSRGGKKGGKARAEKLTAEDRTRIAQIAAQKRWSKKT